MSIRCARDWFLVLAMFALTACSGRDATGPAGGDARIDRIPDGPAEDLPVAGDTPALPDTTPPELDPQAPDLAPELPRMDVPVQDTMPAACDSDKWCEEEYGSGVHCQTQTGWCVPDLAPDYPWCQADADCPTDAGTVCHQWNPSGGRCAPSCDHDDMCIALSPNLLCDTGSKRCYEEQPLVCTADAGCDWMGPDYRCNIDGKCVVLPTPEEGCKSKEDCPMEPEVTLCHKVGAAGHCAPPCQADLDCTELGSGLHCELSSGKCSDEPD